MLPAAPCILLFAAAGLNWVSGRLPAPGIVAALLAAGAFVIQTPRFPVKPHIGYSELAEFLCSSAEWNGAAFLIHSESGAEGAFVAEVALRDRRPNHFVIRDSKWLTSANSPGGVGSLC